MLVNSNKGKEIYLKISMKFEGIIEIYSEN